jgi:hypothetical protein
MDIRFRQHHNHKKWIAEVWTKNDMPGWEEFDEPYPEEVYVEINDWCIETFGYHARTAYHVFEFNDKKDLDWFLLKWLGDNDGNSSRRKN